MKNNEKVIELGSQLIKQGAKTCFLLLIGGCVAPPDYSDGLLENIPAIVDETDYFSLSLLGDDYSEEKEWELSLTSDSTDTILTTLVLADLNISNTDSSILFMMNDSGDTIFQPILLGNVVWSSDIAVNLIGSPKIISLKGDNFTGRLEYQILKK
ncbi:MAG: hypothetical protein HOM19_01140 [Candidatus Marinimicrobia bacterium]|nr:hypothetical protein [Candidatus Neomarinimicrobiota bacterium]